MQGRSASVSGGSLRSSSHETLGGAERSHGVCKGAASLQVILEAHSGEPLQAVWCCILAKIRRGRNPFYTWFGNPGACDRWDCHPLWLPGGSWSPAPATESTFRLPDSPSRPCERGIRTLGHFDT